jgi:2-haloacid dehalogenase
MAAFFARRAGPVNVRPGRLRMRAVARMHGRMPRPAAVVFDVIETLFPLEPLRAKLASLGLARADLDLWFTRILRDAFALDTSGTFAPFRDVARGALEVLLAQRGVAADPAAMEPVLDGFTALEAAPDAAPAFRRLADAGVPVATLSNGGVASSRTLLDRAGLLPLVARVMGVDEIRRYKPGREVYLHAARSLGLAPERLALVAVHAWDVEGAKRAGFVTGWCARLERRFHPAMAPPDVYGADLVTVVEALLMRG